MHFSWICVFICWMVVVTTPGTRSSAIDVTEHIRETEALDDDNNTESESAGEEKPLICYECSGYLNMPDGKECGGNGNLPTIDCYGETAMCFNDVSRPKHISRGCKNDCLRAAEKNRLISCCNEPKCNNKPLNGLAKNPVVYQARVAQYRVGGESQESTPAESTTKSPAGQTTGKGTSGTDAVESTTSASTGKTTKKSMGNNNLAAPALMLLTATIVGIVASDHVI